MQTCCQGNMNCYVQLFIKIGEDENGGDSPKKTLFQRVFETCRLLWEVVESTFDRPSHFSPLQWSKTIGLHITGFEVQLHCTYESGLSSIEMVELTGIEPVTSCLPDKRSSQLSYSPTFSHCDRNIQRVQTITVQSVTYSSRIVKQKI